MRSYAQWTVDMWVSTGGLITPIMASKILNVSEARISQMRAEGKLTTYKDCDERAFLSFSETMHLLNEKQAPYIDAGKVLQESELWKDLAEANSWLDKYVVQTIIEHFHTTKGAHINSDERKQAEDDFIYLVEESDEKVEGANVELLINLSYVLEGIANNNVVHLTTLTPKHTYIINKDGDNGIFKMTIPDLLFA